MHNGQFIEWAKVALQKAMEGIAHKYQKNMLGLEGLDMGQVKLDFVQILNTENNREDVMAIILEDLWTYSFLPAINQATDYVKNK